MAGTLEKITAFHQQIFSSNKYVFINSVNLHQDQKHKTKKQTKQNHKLNLIP